MSSLTLTSRTIADAEVFDAQNALVARAASLVATATNYNLHLVASATYCCMIEYQNSHGVATGDALSFHLSPAEQ